MTTDCCSGHFFLLLLFYFIMCVRLEQRGQLEDHEGEGVEECVTRCVLSFLVALSSSLLFF